MNIVIEMLLDPNNPFMWVLVITLIAGAIASIFRPFSSYVKFVYPNAKYEAMGNPYITQQSLQKLLESGTLQAFVEQLNGTKDYQIQGTTSAEVQHHLDMLFVKTIELMRRDSSKKMHLFYDTYLEYHDIRYIKTAIKLKRKEKAIDETILQHIVSPQVKQLVSLLSSADRESLPDILKDYGFPSSFLLLVHDDEIDAGIDRFFIRRIDEVHVPYKCQQAKHLYVKRLIDVISIELILRAKHRHLNEATCLSFFIDDGYEIPEWKFKELCKANDVAEVITILEGTSYASALKHVKDTIKTTFVQPYEDALDQHMLTVIKDISTQHYTTIGPSLRYLISKETEIKNLKIIAKGLYEQMPLESIKSLLRMETSA